MERALQTSKLGSDRYGACEVLVYCQVTSGTALFTETRDLMSKKHTIFPSPAPSCIVAHSIFQVRVKGFTETAFVRT